MNQHKSEMINSGIIWYGEVPTNWSRTKLKFLADYQNGYPFKPEDWGSLGLPILRIAQLTGESEPNYFAGQISEKLKVNDGDLLFSWSATLDSFIWNGGSAWLNQHIFKVSPTKGTDKKFLYWLLKFITPYLSDIDAHGSAMKHIKKESLGQTVFVPDKKIQENIANFLDFETSKIDRLIHKQQKLIELLNEKIHIATMEIVTKGLNQKQFKSVPNVFWIKEIPSHWSVERIKTIFEIKKRIAGKLGFDVLSITQNGIKVKDIESNDGQQSMDYSKYQIVENGDFAMNHMDLLTGYVDIAKQEGVTSPDYRVFSIRNDSKYYPEYYLLLLQLWRFGELDRLAINSRS